MDGCLSDWHTDIDYFPVLLPLERFDNELMELVWRNGEAVVLHSQKRTEKQQGDDDDSNNQAVSWIDYESFHKEFPLSEIIPIPGETDKVNDISTSTEEGVNENHESRTLKFGDGKRTSSAMEHSSIMTVELSRHSTTNNDGGGNRNKKRRKSRNVEESESPSDDVFVESDIRQKSARKNRVAEVHNLSERRRRDRINEKMRTLQELIPHSHKSDKASLLDDVIEYMKSLQLQVQWLWMSQMMQYLYCHPGMPITPQNLTYLSSGMRQIPQPYIGGVINHSDMLFHHYPTTWMGTDQPSGNMGFFHM